MQVKGFDITYLSKVPEIKDTVHKQSLLHHATQCVLEKFPDVTDLYSELGSVTRCSRVKKTILFVFVWLELLHWDSSCVTHYFVVLLAYFEQETVCIGLSVLKREISHLLFNFQPSVCGQVS